VAGITKANTLITGARVVDGTGNPWFYGDVAIAGDRIQAVAPAGQLDRNQLSEMIDATGMVVCPGFIDIQSHSIIPFLTDRRSVGKVTQGVTTEIMGEHWTPAPFGGRIKTPIAEGVRRLVGDSFDEWVERAKGWTRFGDWLSDLEDRGVSVNVGSFVGGATVRQYGKGEEMGSPSRSELDAMKRCLIEAMEDGAFGLATALIYPPETYTTTEELTELCMVIARYGGVHITHIRSEEDRLLEALDEMIQIATDSGAATEIYHLKAAGPRNWPKMREVIKRIDDSRDRGLDIGADMYPYEASGTGLAVAIPPWAAADGKLFDNLRDPEMRAKIAEEIRHPTEGWENLAAVAGPENVLVASLGNPEFKRYQGKRLSDIAAERGQDWVDAAIDLLAGENSNPFCMFFMMSEENLHLQFQQPWMKFGTDAGGPDPERVREVGLLHPRAYGSYPRILGKYVREQGVIPLEDAVRKSSSAVADRLGIRDRGLLRDGMYADVVIFDPETVIDRATPTNPHQLSVGIRDVFVNGQRVLQDGEHTGAMPGRWVKRT
jgi:N-acyl-D-amino-acid deacylase